MKIIHSKSLHLISSEPFEPLFVKVITRLVRKGVGVVHITPDHHVFIQLSAGITELRGSLNSRQEGKEAGFNVIIRRAPKRGKYSLYTDLPEYQLYTLPIVKKEAATMSDSERLNIERNTLVLKRLHAIEHNPIRLAHYRRLHRAHLLNPTAGGYKKRCTTFRCFLIAILHLELATPCSALGAVPPSISPAFSALPLSNIMSIAPACHAGISPSRRANILHLGDIFIAAHPLRFIAHPLRPVARSRPLIRLPMHSLCSRRAG